MEFAFNSAPLSSHKLYPFELRCLALGLSLMLLQVTPLLKIAHQFAHRNTRIQIFAPYKAAMAANKHLPDDPVQLEEGGTENQVCFYYLCLFILLALVLLGDMDSLQRKRAN